MPAHKRRRGRKPSKNREHQWSAHFRGDMRRDAKIKAAIWLGGAFLVLLTLGYVIGTFAESASEAHSYYLDSNAGDDSNSGRSPSSAWRTIGKINSITLAPGDTVYFLRGAMWRETLESE